MFALRRKKWSEMSIPARVGFVVIGLIQVSLLIAALADIRKRPAAQINGSKALWAGLVFINFVGPIAYFVKGRKRLPAATEPTA
ncbi:MAG: hypothetical protein DWI57_16880 [Chloroflexi bacterium]|nr:MAG: hypothetical protein DWI57_16880 [Chloroflexota bacterium]